MPWKNCLTDEERQFRRKYIQPTYNAQSHDNWGDNGEVMAFYCFRLYKEVQRLRGMLLKNRITLGPEADWFEIPAVGPGTERPGTPAGESPR